MKLIDELKVPELHDELARRKLSKKGKKQELIEVCMTSFDISLVLIALFGITLMKIAGEIKHDIFLNSACRNTCASRAKILTRLISPIG